MAYDTDEHVTGRRALTDNKKAFEDSGFACNDILHDYGEDFLLNIKDMFFTVTKDEVGVDGKRIVEPFKIFVQSKGTSKVGDDVDWTEYVPPLTVRNWVLANELVVVVKREIESDVARYCIPEEDYDYFEIHDYLFTGRNIPIKCVRPFTKQTPRELVWRARIRHYDRLIRLCLPDNPAWREVPKATLFAWELLGRIGCIEGAFLATDAVMERLGSYRHPEPFQDKEGMTKDEQRRFADCCLILNDRFNELTPGYVWSAAFLEHCAIALTKSVIMRMERDG